MLWRAHAILEVVDLRLGLQTWHELLKEKERFGLIDTAIQKLECIADRFPQAYRFYTANQSWAYISSDKTVGGRNRELTWELISFSFPLRWALILTLGPQDVTISRPSDRSFLVDGLWIVKPCLSAWFLTAGKIWMVTARPWAPFLLFHTCEGVYRPAVNTQPDVCFLVNGRAV